VKISQKILSGHQPPAPAGSDGQIRQAAKTGFSGS